jgi:hypothetical protein
VFLVSFAERYNTNRCENSKDDEWNDIEEATRDRIRLFVYEGMALVFSIKLLRAGRIRRTSSTVNIWRVTFCIGLSNAVFNSLEW